MQLEDETFVIEKFIQYLKEHMNKKFELYINVNGYIRLHNIKLEREKN